MKVKIFNTEYAHILEKEINEFIEKIEKEHMEVKDIIPLRPGNECGYKVLMMYGPDGSIYLPCSDAVPDISAEEILRQINDNINRIGE